MLSLGSVGTVEPGLAFILSFSSFLSDFDFFSSFIIGIPWKNVVDFSLSFEFSVFFSLASGRSVPAVGSFEPASSLIFESANFSFFSSDSVP
jgi:hypothetical protein